MYSIGDYETLGPPPPADTEKDVVRIVALGGLGEVGMNCTMIECNGEIVVVDCGVTFPETPNFGVNLLMPDWSYLLENMDRVVAVVITHGHEDHIGAVPYLMRHFQGRDVPVYGTQLTLTMIRHKLRERNLLGEVKLVEIVPREELDLGDFFGLEVVRVNHSIPDAVSVALHTCLGTILMTGDFRVDYTPYAGEVIDLPRFGELGDEGVLCLLGDSTNVLKPGTSVSESEVARGLEQVIAQSEHRVVVALFSSNLYRVQALLDSAHKLGRRVLLMGRSLMNNVGFGRECGLIRLPSDDILVELRDAKSVPRDKLLILTTGSQGEPRSGLVRIAFHQHDRVSLSPGDKVVFSARIIPGNELSISRLMNTLWRQGVEVITKDDALIHTTGHGYRDELKLMLKMTRPHYFVPVHGETRMLVRHATVAEQMGVPETFVMHNGDVLEIDGEGARVCGHVPTGRVFVDGDGVAGDVEDVMLRDRRKMARSGMVIVWTVLDVDTGEIVSGPEIVQRGVIDGDDNADVLREVTAEANLGLSRLNEDQMRSPGEVGEAIRLAVRRYFKRHYRRKPVVIPMVIDI